MQILLRKLKIIEEDSVRLKDFKFNKKNFYPKENEKYFYIPLSKVSSNGEIEQGLKKLGGKFTYKSKKKSKKRRNNFIFY